MTNIYEQHDAAFRNVSAYVITKDGKQVARVSIKFGGQVCAYFHAFHSRMTKGIARGGNYDRASAAIETAVSRIEVADDIPDENKAIINGLKTALQGDSGSHWDNRLYHAGFDVMRAV